mmetsp:Transcript_10250/g.15435  ORF Transcript_10250/g.15435 Transcript_10250/m.15435 type:complete len:440 (+) Transcript_10250:53-1372(+)
MDRSELAEIHAWIAAKIVDLRKERAEIIKERAEIINGLSDVHASSRPSSHQPPVEASPFIPKRSDHPTTPPPNPSNPYSDWDPRHASRTSYLQEAKRRARMEETASIKIQRWLTKRLFIRNINRHLRCRTHNKQLCRGASSYAKELASTGRIKSPAPAPTIKLSPITPKRQQPYPSAEETHAFRHRGLSLPLLPSKKKKRRKRYKSCYRPTPRTKRESSSTTSSPASHLPSTCQVTHPTRGCPHCPAFFFNKDDLIRHHFSTHHEDLVNNQMSCMDKVSPTDETTPVSNVDIDLPQNPCPPSPSSAQPSSTTYRSNPSNTNEQGRHQDRVPSPDETPPVSATDVDLPQNSHPLSREAVIRVSVILSQLHTALQQLPANLLLLSDDPLFFIPRCRDDLKRILQCRAEIEVQYSTSKLWLASMNVYIELFTNKIWSESLSG